MSENTGAERVDLNELKSGGFIKQNQKDLFTVRLRVPGGRLDIDKMIKIGKVAKKYRTAIYKEFPNHAHWIMTEPGWQDVAEYISGWLTQQRAD